MSDGLNRAMLIGNLCADPELRFTQGGTGVLNIRLATNESWIDKAGTKQERTEYHSITVWEKRAEGLAKILHKGDRIYAEGRIQTTSYEDKDGQKRWKTEIVAQDVILCGGRRAEGAVDGGARSRPARPDPGGYTPPAGGAGVGDDEPPF